MEDTEPVVLLTPAQMNVVHRGASLSKLAVTVFREIWGRPDFEFRVYGEPKPAGSKRVVPIGGVNVPRRFQAIDDNPKSGSWKKDVAHRAGEAMLDWAEQHRSLRPMFRRPLMVVFDFTVRRPKGHFRKNGELSPSAPEHPAKKPDDLKLARGVEDAMEGVVYHNDAQIVIELLVKRYGEPEGVDVQLWELAE